MTLEMFWIGIAVMVLGIVVLALALLVKRPVQADELGSVRVNSGLSNIGWSNGSAVGSCHFRMPVVVAKT